MLTALSDRGQATGPRSQLPKHCHMAPASLPGGVLDKSRPENSFLLITLVSFLVLSLW